MKKITVLLLILLSVCCLGGLSAKASSTVTISGPSTIHKAKNSILTTSDIISFYTSNFGHVAVSTDNYTGNGNIKGTYLIELYASVGNDIGSKQLNVIVVDSLPSTIKAIGDNKNLYTSNEKTITNQDVLSALDITGHINFNVTTQMYILNNQYTSNYQTPGQYFYEFRLIDTSGYDNIFSLNIIVSDSNTLSDPDYTYQRPESSLTKLFNLLKTVGIIFLGVFAFYLFYKHIIKKLRGIIK